MMARTTSNRASLSDKTTYFVNTGLKKNATYYYKVRSYKTVNGKKVYGDYSSVYSKKITK